MRRIVDYVISCIYGLYFLIVLAVFHVIQVVCLNLFGRKIHQQSVHWMNFFLLFGTYIYGTSISFKQQTELPTDRPIIFVANHQSMFDIIGMIWFLRKNYPLFVSKIELAKGIPGVSYNLRKSGSALIDRKEGKQAIVEIGKLGKLIEEIKYSAVIFPEGTRSRNEKMKPFSVGGVAILIKKAPSALVVPVAVNGTGHFNPKGVFPLVCFSKLSWVTLQPIEPKGKTAEEVVRLAEEAIADFKGQKVVR